MNKNLLKEAIADAEAIKKLAVENAKASLNQAFDSKIKSMLASRLDEEADELEEGYEEDDDTKPKDEAAQDNQEEADEAFDIDAILAEMEEDTNYEMEEGKGKKGDDEEPAKSSDDDDMPSDDDDMPSDDGVDEELDLEALLAELASDDDQIDENADQEEENTVNEGFADWLKSIGKDVKDLASDKLAKFKKFFDEEISTKSVSPGGKYYGDKSTASTNVNVHRMAETDIDEADDEPMKKIGDILKKHKEKQSHKANTHKANTPKDEEYNALQEQVKILSEKMKETNLINAKLLYVNKIMNENDLSAEQKIKVLNAFDQATTVKEAKLIHSSLSEAFKVKTAKPKTTNIKESLGFASKAAGTSTRKEIIAEADQQVSRWQKLAGIKLN
jgi:hypothetical protein